MKKNLIISLVVILLFFLILNKESLALADGDNIINEERNILDIYISQDGDDSNNGSYRYPINSLDKAYKIAVAYSTESNISAINIHILPGIYYSQTLSWNWNDWDWEKSPNIDIVNIVGDQEEKTIFDGTACDLSYFMQFQTSSSKTCKFTVSNLQIQNYANGIYIVGNERDRVNSNTGYNIIENVEFNQIGDNYSNVGVGYAAIDMKYSSHNIVRNCKFYDIVNNQANEALMHGVYMSWGSSYNEIYNNTFENVSSDPIRVRDNSNYNKIYSNTFTKTGKYGYCSDWYDPQKEEEISFGNEFYNNALNSSYSNSQIDETAIIGQIYKQKSSYNENTDETTYNELVYTAKLSTDSSRIYAYDNEINSKNERRQYVRKISIIEKPDKLEYVANTDKLNLEGGIIDIVYATDSANIIERVSLTNTIFTITGFDNTRIGTNTITVQYTFTGANQQEKTVYTTFDVEIVGTNLKKGDINKDGKLTLYDVFSILRKVVLGDILSEEEIYIMDYNEDKKITLYDAFSFLRQVILKD